MTRAYSLTHDFIDRRTSRRNSLLVLFAATSLASVLACSGDDNKDKSASETAALQPTPGGATPNGLSVPAGVQDWGVVGVAAHSDDNTLRVIVGNDIAVSAARSGQTNPWPEGTMLSHFVWAAEQNPDDASTTGPGDFAALTLMEKNSQKYAADGGWAYGMWTGPELTPPADPTFDRACVNCHTSLVSDKDFVFTVPGVLPDEAAVGGAAPGGNGVAFPAKILDWKVIGVASVAAAPGAAPSSASIRVIVGNPTAVTAARSGKTNPWPDGSMISHYNWAAGTNPDAAGVITPGGFNAFTLMQRSSALYPADGNWAYGVWGSSALSPLPAGGDRACVNCHTTSEPLRDDVFSRVGVFPPSLVP